MDRRLGRRWRGGVREEGRKVDRSVRSAMSALYIMEDSGDSPEEIQ